MARIYSAQGPAGLGPLVEGDQSTQAAVQPAPEGIAFTDFHATSLGAMPAGWSVLAGDAGWTVVADTDALSGRCLQCLTGAADLTNLLQWDYVGEGDTYQEMAIRYKVPGPTSPPRADDYLPAIEPSMHVSPGPPGEPNKVAFTFGRASSGGATPASFYRLYEIAGGSYNGFAAANQSLASGAWRYLRAQLKYAAGTWTLRFNHWTGDVADEPAGWQLEQTGSVASIDGAVGLGAYFRDQTYRVDRVGVSFIDGTPAPLLPL